MIQPLITHAEILLELSGGVLRVSAELHAPLIASSGGPPALIDADLNPACIILINLPVVSRVLSLVSFFGL